jgi:HNH endonuclease
MSARSRIRAFFEANVGRIVTTRQIGRIARISDYQRRIRELREKEGMQIKSHVDDPALKPGQYLLETLERAPVIEHGISASLRTEILARNGFTCEWCGRGSGDVDPLNPNRKVRLHIDHRDPEGGNARSNLRVLCSACNQGKSNVQPASEKARDIIARLRKISRAEKQEVYERLRTMLGS